MSVYFQCYYVHMLDELLLLISGLYLAWSLGANDATNIISMAVGSKTISFKKAMVFFVICLAFGSIFLSKNVIKTVSSGIVDSELITINHAIIALFVAAVWVHFATWKHWPVSISQSVVSGVMGIGIAESFRIGGNLVEWEMILKVASVWLFSPVIGFLAGFLIFKLIRGFVPYKHMHLEDTIADLVAHPFATIRDWTSGRLRRREHIFKIILLLSAGYMAVALGANTIASTTGLIYSGLGDRDQLVGVSFGTWDPLLVVKLLVLVAVILGVVTYGHKLVDFMGKRLLKLNPMRGAVIQSSASTVIIVAALLGFPVSSTGIFVGSFLGVNSGEDKEDKMKNEAMIGLAVAFLVTIPVTAFLSGVLTWFFV